MFVELMPLLAGRTVLITVAKKENSRPLPLFKYRQGKRGST